MELAVLQSKLNTYKKGTFVKVVWEKDVASANARKQGISIIKRCEGIVRAGVTYANIDLVKKLMENKPVEQESKPSWFEHVGQGIVQHKTNTEKKYLQLFFVNGKKIKSTFKFVGSDEKINANKLYEDGLITKADLPKQSDEPLITMVVGLENLLSFGK